MIKAYFEELDRKASKLKGFHVHTNPIDLEKEDKCTDAGGHFNPTGVTHSVWNGGSRHTGDLKMLRVKPNGTGRLAYRDPVA